MNLQLVPLSVISGFHVPLRGHAAPDQDVLAEVISARLSEKQARNIGQSHNRVTFEGPGLLGVPGWQPFALVDKGEVTVLSHDDTVEVRYAIRYTRYALVLTAASLVGGVFLGINFGPLVGVIAFPFVWFIVARLNIATSANRVLDWLQRSAWDAVDEVSRPRHTSDRSGGAA
jgi:hypothetical protein